MKKMLLTLVGAVFVTLLMAGGASAQTEEDVVFPVDGECPAGFELGYSDEFGEVCDETLERGDEGDDVTVTPAAAAAAPGATALPRTGSDSSLPLAQMGAVLLAAGGLVVLAARKRATHTS